MYTGLFDNPDSWEKRMITALRLRLLALVAALVLCIATSSVGYQYFDLGVPEEFKKPRTEEFPLLKEPIPELEGLDLLPAATLRGALESFNELDSQALAGLLNDPGFSVYRSQVRDHIVTLDLSDIEAEPVLPEPRLEQGFRSYSAAHVELVFLLAIHLELEEDEFVDLFDASLEEMRNSDSGALDDVIREKTGGEVDGLSDLGEDWAFRFERVWLVGYIYSLLYDATITPVQANSQTSKLTVALQEESAATLAEETWLATYSEEQIFENLHDLSANEGLVALGLSWVDLLSGNPLP